MTFPPTIPPKTCPCAPARHIPNDGFNDVVGEEEEDEDVVVSVGEEVVLVLVGPTTEPERERRVKGPWRERAGAWDIGWRSVTLETDPEPLRSVMPTRRRLANWITESTTSDPAEISRTTGFMAESESLVMTMGGLGLFLDPGGRPRGFLVVSDNGEKEERGRAVLRGLEDVFAGKLRGLWSESLFWSSEVGERSLPPPWERDMAAPA